MRKLLWIGTLVALPGVVQGAGNTKPSPQTVLGVPCSEIFERGIDKQENLRAGLIRIGCGLDAPGAAGPEGASAGSVADFTNLNLITGGETFPHVTQSESMVWSTPDGLNIVINYNDSSGAPLNYSGVSVSADGGQTLARILPAPFATGHGTNFGDPIVVFNVRLNQWFAGDLVGGFGNCGTQGIGLWTAPGPSDVMNWGVGACAYNGSGADRESMWVDNNPGSPFYGRMYISWNDFTLGGNIYVTSSDDGTTWLVPVRVNTGTFVRNVQITGSPGDDGTVFIAGMDEGSGHLDDRINIIFRSIDGGATWTRIQMGAPFAAPGQALCGYFAAIPPIWRHMGWGQPAVGPNGVVHYVYTGKGREDDLGDIFYTRSDDNGTTWSTSIVLNTDAAQGGTQAQWMPSLSVTPEGIVRATWYDRRNTTDGTSYEYYVIASQDNGLTWGSDQPVTDVPIVPQPEQPDPQVQSCHAGDYNYQTSIGSKTWITWTDGRNPIDGHFQQDVYFAALDTITTGGTIEGLVTDSGTGTPIARAQVRAVGPVDRIAANGPDGVYRIRLFEGIYDLTASAFGYNSSSAIGVAVVDGQATIQNFALTAGPAHGVSGTVTASGTGPPISGAQVRILHSPLPPAPTGPNGMYQFSSVPEGTYAVQASTPGFASMTQSGVVVDHDVIVDFALETIALCDGIPGNLVMNCGFESGTFSDWTRSGDLSLTTIETSSAHTGSFGVSAGPQRDLGFIAQSLATTPGASYSLCYWLRNLGGHPNR